jgi:nitrogen fixation protein FixH
MMNKASDAGAPADASRFPTDELSGPRASRAAWLWGSFVVGFLILQLVAGGLAIALAARDPSVAVMPDYHEKALRWDEEIARQQRSEALNWNAEVAVALVPNQPQLRNLSVRVVDANGEPIAGGTAELSFFHHTRAADFTTRSLSETEPGIYSATLPMSRSGLWDIDFTLGRNADERFRDSRTLELGDQP